MIFIVLINVIWIELQLLSEFLLEPPNSHIMKRYITEVHHLKVMMTLLKVYDSILSLPPMMDSSICTNNVVRLHDRK